MADVDMPDASSTVSAKAKGPGLGKVSKAGAPADSSGDGKKRFEVKKVSMPSYLSER